VTKDAVLLQELRSLKEELSAARQAPSAPSEDRTSASNGNAAPVGKPEVTADQRQLHGDLHEFMDEITKLIEDAEKNVLTHSTASVIGAMIVGILIGRFLGRH